MGFLKTIKFEILERFILSLGYKFIDQTGSHKKYSLFGKVIIIPKHKIIARGTLNNIFKIISLHNSITKENIIVDFLEFIK